MNQGSSVLSSQIFYVFNEMSVPLLSPKPNKQKIGNLLNNKVGYEEKFIALSWNSWLRNPACWLGILIESKKETDSFCASMFYQRPGCQIKSQKKCLCIHSLFCIKLYSWALRFLNINLRNSICNIMYFKQNDTFFFCSYFWNSSHMEIFKLYWSFYLLSNGAFVRKATLFF